MTFTDAPPAPAPKPCWHGSKCSNKNCKFAHTPPPEADSSSNAENGHAAGGGHDQAVKHIQPPSNKPKGKQAGKKANHGDKPPTKKVKQSQENTPKQTSATIKDASPLRKPSTKLCKFGDDCRRSTCPYQHPATEEVTSIPPSDNDAKTEGVKKNARNKSERRTSTKKSEIGSVPDTSDLRAEGPARKTKTKLLEPKVKKPCRAGANCLNAKCTFLHPHEGSAAPIHSSTAKSRNIAMTDVTVLEQFREEQAIKDNKQQAIWVADLEESMVAEVIKTTPELKKTEAKRSRQQKRRQEEEEAERLRLEKEEEELHFLLQEQEHQRLAEAEAEHRLQEQKAEEERKTKERFRREKEKEEHRKRATKRIEQEAKHLAEGERKRRETLRQEQEEMERRKRAFEAMRKEAEDAKNQAEKERNKQEEELLYFAKLKAEKERLLKEEEEECLHLEEDERRYKEERKAAKKERKRREQEARAKLQREACEKALKGSPTNSNRDVQSPTKTNRDMQSPTNSDRENVDNFNTFHVAPDARLEEEARKRRVQEELRLQKERTNEKKKWKQKLRRERFLEDLERQTQERTQFWQKEIADEKRAVEILMHLCVAEFCRKNLGVDRQAVLSDPDAKARIEEVAQQTYRIICKTDCHSRFTVKGMKQQDLNDRTGTIERWDENKGKFYVALDTKKGKNLQYMYFAPENLEVLPNDFVRKSKKKGDSVHTVFIVSLYDGKELMSDIYKSEVDALKESFCLDDYLASLMKERDMDERLAKEQEDDELRQEEEARRRRDEQRRQEAEEWEKRKREYEAQKEQYQEWRREERRERKSSRTHRGRGSGCNCPQCQFERLFFGDMRGGMGCLPGFFFSSGGGPGFGRRGFSFGEDYSDEDYDYEDEWDRQWNRKHEEEEFAKNEEFADVLGVEMDATVAEIKRVYRKKALKYHPDKYRAENHEDGMTKDKAEEHFKELTNAYDHLMSKFDD